MGNPTLERNVLSSSINWGEMTYQIKAERQSVMVFRGDRPVRGNVPEIRVSRKIKRERQEDLAA